MYHYYDGQEVREGDIVLPGMRDNKGTVVKVLAPGTPEAKNMSAPEGGILIEVMWEDGPELFLLPCPDGENWEDVELVQRGEGRR